MSKSWYRWGLEEGSGIESWSAASVDSPGFYYWKQGIEHGKKYEDVVKVARGDVGSVGLPTEFRNFLIKKLPSFNHLSPNFKPQLLLERSAPGEFPVGERRTYQAPPIGLRFFNETCFYNPENLLGVLEDFINTLLPPEQPKELTMSTNPGTISVSLNPTPKTLTLSPTNARVVRMQAIKLIKSLTKKFVETKLPETERIGVMKFVADILDRDIPDAVVLSLAAWLTDTIGPSVIPAKFLDVSKTISLEFRQEGEAIAKSTGVDMLKEVGGPMVMALWGMVEKYVEESPVEVGPDKQMEAGLDMKEVKASLEQEKISVKRSATQKVS